MGCISSSNTERPVSRISKRQAAIVRSRIQAQQTRQEAAHKKNVQRGLNDRGEFGRGIHDAKYTDSHLAALAKITHFSVSILRQLESLFAVISDSIVEDQLIDKTELSDALGLRPDSLLFRTLFRLFDVTHTNSINFRTWILTLSSLSPEASIYEKQKFSFDICDLDGNGTIALDEVKSLLVAAVSDIIPDQQPNEVEEQCKSTVADMDQDGDGNIDYSEYEKVMLSNPIFLESFTIDIEKLLIVLQRQNSALGMRLNIMLEQIVEQREYQFKIRKFDHSQAHNRTSAVDLMEEARLLCDQEEMTLIEAQELVWSNHLNTSQDHLDIPTYAGNMILSTPSIGPKLRRLSEFGQNDDSVDIHFNLKNNSEDVYNIEYDTAETSISPHLDVYPVKLDQGNAEPTFLVVKPNTFLSPLKSNTSEKPNNTKEYAKDNKKIKDVKNVRSPSKKEKNANKSTFTEESNIGEQSNELRFILPSDQNGRRSSLQLDVLTKQQYDIPESYVAQHVVLEDKTLGLLYLPKENVDKLQSMVIYDDGHYEPIVVISDLQDLDVDVQKVPSNLEQVTQSSHPLQKLLAKLRNWQDEE